MAATNNPLRRRLLQGAVAILATGLCGPAALAHPLPGTRVTLIAKDGALILAVEIPLPELALALPQAGLATATALTPDQQDQLLRYFRAHLAMEDAAGLALPVSAARMTVRQVNTADTGPYPLLFAAITLQTPPGGAEYPLHLRYDAVIHQVRNHSALVFTAAASGLKTLIGSIRYDFTLKQVPPLEIPAP